MSRVFTHTRNDVADRLRFYKRIEDAYIYANKTLLKLMLEEQELIPHLRCAMLFLFSTRAH